MDIEVFRTSSEEERKKCRKLLLDRHLSYSEKWVRIPMLQRQKHQGKKEMCVFYINDFYENQKEELQRMLQQS
ncbi:MAG: hypothetical protein II073_00460 [Lachnospiraceae bacterium]|nr:hypothetical protein [Lachnospiraceae bacterium]